LFNDAFATASVYTTSNVKKTARYELDVDESGSHDLLEGDQENNNKKVTTAVDGQRIEPGTFRIRIRSLNLHI
jgi:hypothetical protein